MCGGGGDRFVDIYTTVELLWLWLHFHTVSGDFVVTASVARAAELLVVRRPVSLITSPVLEPWRPTTWWPTTSPHVYWEGSTPLSAHRKKAMLQWQLPVVIWTDPHFQLKLLTSHIPLRAFWLSLILGSQVLNCWGKGQWICQVVTATLNNITCQESWPTMARQRALLGWLLPSREQGKQDRRGANSLFVKHTLFFSLGFGLCLEWWGLW